MLPLPPPFLTTLDLENLSLSRSSKCIKHCIMKIKVESQLIPQFTTSYYYEIDEETGQEIPIRRQGRNRKSRENSQKHKDVWKAWEQNVQEVEPCCEDRVLVEDHNNGDVICTSCGEVDRTQGGLGFQKNTLVLFKKSPPYRRVVHWRQRRAELKCIDPKLSEFMLVKIERELYGPEREEKYPGDSTTWGKRTFSNVLHALGYPRKLACRWIQIRERLNFLPARPIVPDELLKRVEFRYDCIQRIFDQTLCTRNKELLKKRSEIDKCRQDEANSILPHWKGLYRRNIPNINYLFVQMVRLDSEEWFHELLPWFPQLSGEDQPSLNNMRWSVLLGECRKHYPVYSNPKGGKDPDEEPIFFNWDYKPLDLFHVLVESNKFL